MCMCVTCFPVWILVSVSRIHRTGTGRVPGKVLGFIVVSPLPVELDTAPPCSHTDNHASVVAVWKYFHPFPASLKLCQSDWLQRWPFCGVLCEATLCWLPDKQILQENIQPLPKCLWPQTSDMVGSILNHPSILSPDPGVVVSIAALAISHVVSVIQGPRLIWVYLICIILLWVYHTGLHYSSFHHTSYRGLCKSLQNCCVGALHWQSSRNKRK